MAIMDVQEAATQAGVHPQTVRGWIHRGHLRAQRVGRSFAIDERDLKKLLANPPKPGRPPRRKSK